VDADRSRPSRAVPPMLTMSDVTPLDGPAVGFRSWELHEDGQLVPRIDLCPGQLVGGEELSASYSLDSDALREEFARRWRILGAIRSSHIFSSAEGFRCAEAVVVALARSPLWGDDENRAAERAARRRGVPLVDLKRLVAVASEHGSQPSRTDRPPPFAAPPAGVDATTPPEAHEEAAASPTSKVTRELDGSASHLGKNSDSLGYLRTGIQEGLNRRSTWAGQLTTVVALVASLAIVAFWVATSYEGVFFPLLLGALAAGGMAYSAPAGSFELAEAAAVVGGGGGALYGLMPILAQRSAGISFAVLVIAGVMLATALAWAVKTALYLPPEAAAPEQGAGVASVLLPLAATGAALAISLSPALACLVIAAVEVASLHAWRRATEGRVRRSAD